MTEVSGSSKPPVRTRKVLVTSAVLPPMASGSAKMMRNLLMPFPRESLVLLRANNSLFKLAQDAPLGEAEVVDMPNLLRKRDLRIGISRYLEYLWVPWIARRMARVARRKRVTAIFANYPYGYFLLASWIAARLTGLPLFVYMHSLWEETTDAPCDRWMARLFEGKIFRTAAAVYVPTSFAADHYRRKHGIEPRLLPHAVYLADGLPPESAPARPRRADICEILFTGGVYNMNRDALRGLVEAVESMERLPDGRDVRLTVCAPNDPAVLASLAIGGRRVDVGHVDTQTAMRMQREADILYLPLAFETPWKDEVRTVYPTKAVEYLVSGTPILLHAPSESYTVHEARDLGWGLVVDRQDPMALQDAVRRLATDRTLSESLVTAARKAAEGRDARRIAADLQRDLGLA